jgi:hypothetical protein
VVVRRPIPKDPVGALYDYGKNPTEEWVANVAFFQILLFAYNLVHGFKRLCLPRDYLYAALDTIRTDFLVLPAKLAKKGSQNVLVLPHDYHYQTEFQDGTQENREILAASIFLTLRLPESVESHFHGFCARTSYVRAFLKLNEPVGQ